MKPSDDEVRKAARLLMGNSIILVVNGFFTIGIEDAVEFVRDRDVFYARMEGVSVEHYKKMKAFEEAGSRCSHVTERGQCKLTCHCWNIKKKDFVFGWDDLCPVHKSKIMKSKSDIADNFFRAMSAASTIKNKTK